MKANQAENVHVLVAFRHVGSQARFVRVRGPQAQQARQSQQTTINIGGRDADSALQR
jgi:hypothetical protein